MSGLRIVQHSLLVANAICAVLWLYIWLMRDRWYGIVGAVLSLVMVWVITQLINITRETESRI
jgi:membrane-bound metal-dependent hydrolase YbcI (DUF457 family)